MTTLLKDRFEIESQLSRTDFSTVFLGCDRKYAHQPPCLITAIPYQQREIRHRLEREAQILERLSHHPQIPRLLSYFYKADPDDKQAGVFYLVQDRIEGHPISQEILAEAGKPKKLSEGYVTKLIKDVLVPLASAHEQGVVHQRLHPQHLIRQDVDGQVFLTEFGAIAKIAQSKITSQGTTGSSIPNALHPYTAPEQLSTEIGPQPASDLYALGLIAIEALTGESHHSFTYDPNKGLQWREQVEVSLPLAEFIDRMIRHDWRDRFPKAQDALQTFKAQTARQQIANNSRLPTVIAAPGGKFARGQTTQVGQTQRGSTTQSHRPKAIPLNPAIFKFLIGSVAAMLAVGIGVKSYQWGEYRLSQLPQTWQDWRESEGEEPEAAEPDALVPLMQDGSILMQPEAVIAFWEMVAAARSEDIELYPLSSYIEGDDDYATGYVVDIGGPEEATDKQADFAETSAFIWLKDNAKAHGFELAVAQDRWLGTQFKAPWRWRYREK